MIRCGKVLNNTLNQFKGFLSNLNCVLKLFILCGIITKNNFNIAV